VFNKEAAPFFSPNASAWRAGLPDFSGYNISKRGTIYQITTKYNKWPKNIPNGRKIFQMAIKYTKWQDLPKFTQIGIFGLKTNHLATLN
jgi:hypothetical protein